MIRTVGEWLPRAVADGADLEARSRMLLAAHYAGVGQQSGTGVGAVHAIGHAIGTRGRLAHGTALATVMPEVFETYLGVRDRELALVAVALGAASPRDDEAVAARAGIDAVRALLECVGQRRTLRELGIPEDVEHVIVRDAIDDAAIDNSPACRAPPRWPASSRRSAAEASPMTPASPAVRMGDGGATADPARIQTMATSTDKAGRIDTGLREATGKGRDEWYAELDAWGAAGKPYAEVAAWLTQHGMSDWWAQKTIVEYEQVRGVRGPGARRDGTFTAGASKSIDVRAGARPGGVHRSGAARPLAPGLRPHRAIVHPGQADPLRRR